MGRKTFDKVRGHTPHNDGVVPITIALKIKNTQGRIMKKFIFLAIVVAIALLISNNNKANIPALQKTFVVEAKNEFVGKVKFDNLSVRVIILRHCWDDVGVTDTKQAIQAVNVAASKGLTIKEIGDHNINKNGTISRNVSWSAPMDFSGLKSFISEQMKVSAESGDTFVIYTIGHGGGDGDLVTLGQRRDIMKTFAEAAAENEQETFWWQLSCHAAAHLPAISTLSEKEQEHFSMIASSPANELSWFLTQGSQMQKVFIAMANKSTEIDPDQDEIITAGELRRFLNKHVSRGRGDLLFARSDDEPIFGVIPLARKIPIVDRDNPQREYKRDYIAIPSRKYN